ALEDGRVAVASVCITLWDARDNQPLTLGTRRAAVRDLTVMPDGRFAWRNGDGINFWDHTTGKGPGVSRFAGGVRAMAFLPDGRIAIAIYDGTTGCGTPRAVASTPPPRSRPSRGA